MLSRRNIRIKVMQALYAMKQDETLDAASTEKNYYKTIDDSRRLYTYSLYHLQQVIEYTKRDAAIKSSKFIPNEEEEANIQLFYNNTYAQILVNNEALSAAGKKDSLTALIDTDIIRSVYKAFMESAEWTAYLSNEEQDAAAHQDMILSLYKIMIKNELFLEQLDDVFPVWLDDKSLIIGAVKKTLKALLENNSFIEEYVPDEETTHEFGGNLLYRVTRQEEDLLAYIAPKLKNWEVDRVAILDMIMMKMAVAEMLYFKTIPTKVSINEYIDIAKNYSTPKSKDFINGLLDRVLKQLEEEDKIEKDSRGLQEE